jgi:hypothetical protein
MMGARLEREGVRGPPSELLRPPRALLYSLLRLARTSRSCWRTFRCGTASEWVGQEVEGRGSCAATRPCPNAHRCLVRKFKREERDRPRLVEAALSLAQVRRGR